MLCSLSYWKQDYISENEISTNWIILYTVDYVVSSYIPDGSVEHTVFMFAIVEAVRSSETSEASYKLCTLGWDSSVSIAMAWGMNGQGSIPGRNKRFLSIPQRPDLLWAPESLPPPPNTTDAVAALSQGREADHAPPAPHISSWRSA
jgi:hypothetical protein